MTNRRRLNISLRVFLLVVLALGLWMGWLTNSARRQRHTAETIREYGGLVYYDHQLRNNQASPESLLLPDMTSQLSVPRPLRWLHKHVGDDYFQRIAGVSLISVESGKGRGVTRPTDDEIMDSLSGLKSLRALILEKAQTTDDSVKNLRGLRHLESVVMINAHDLSDVGVSHFRGLTNLRLLQIDNTEVSNKKITNKSLSIFGQLKALEQLGLQGCPNITNKGLKHIRGLTNLKLLSISECDVSDAGVEHLLELHNLEHLFLRDTQITGRALDQLLTLPNLKHIYVSDCSNLTQSEVDELKRSHPAIRITY